MRIFALLAALFWALPISAEPLQVLSTRTIDVIERSDLEAELEPLRQRDTDQDAALNELRLSMDQGLAMLRDAMEGVDATTQAYILRLIGEGIARDAAILELRTQLTAIAADIHTHDSTPPDPDVEPPPPPPTGNPYEALEYNTWGQYGPAISSVWSEVDPPLDELTRGTEGLKATVKQWCGAAWNHVTKKFRKTCGGHRSTGYARAYEYDAYGLTVRWLTGDFRLVGPNMPVSSCPYPSEDTVLGRSAGMAASHLYDALATTVNDETIIFSVVPYDCKGPGNREPGSLVWKITSDGEWVASELGANPSPSGGVALEPLPDGKVLAVGRYFAGIFDPEMMQFVPYRQGNTDYAAHSSYRELGPFGNLTSAGVDEDGALVFYHSGFHKNLYRIKLSQDPDGLWNLGWPIQLPGIKAAGYTAGMEHLPDHDALVYWWGTGGIRYIVDLSGAPQERTALYPEIVRPADTSYHIHEGGLQWDADAKVLLGFGGTAGDGIWAFRPPVDLITSSVEALPPPVALQPIIDAAAPGTTILLTEPRYGPARITRADLTIECAPGVEIIGQLQGKGTLLLAAPNFTMINCIGAAGYNSDNNASVIFGDFGSNGATFQGVTFRDSDNGILTSKHAAGTYIVQGSFFRNLGAGGRGHAYYDSSVTSVTIIEDSVFELPKGDGHLIKSRALRTTIRNNQILGNTEAGQPSYSRLIDIPEGGHVVIQNNYMEHGHPPGNDDAICIGCEYNQHGDRRTTDENSNVIIDNVVQGFGGVPRFINVHARYPVAIVIDPAQIAADNEINGFEKVVSGR